MKHFFVFIIIIPLLASAFSRCSVSHRVVEKERFEWLFGTRKVKSILVDSRSPADFEKGHMKGAVNLDISNPAFAVNLKVLSGDVNLIFIYSGNIPGTMELMETMKGIYSRYIFSGPYGIYYLKDGYGR